MAELPSLPDAIAAAVGLLVDSLDSLAVIILLAGEPDRSWTLDQVAERLRMPTHVAGRELERLSAEGMAVILSGQVQRYLYAPADEIRAAAAERLVHFHATRRVELINHVASRTLARVRIAAAPPAGRGR